MDPVKKCDDDASGREVDGTINRANIWRRYAQITGAKVASFPGAR